jgi:hypothetical protein
MQIKYGPYSPSRLETSECPHRFYREYIAKDLDDDGSKAANRGSVVHEMLEEVTNGWLKDKPLKISDVDKILPQKLSKYLVTSSEEIGTIARTVHHYMANPPEGLEYVVGTEEQMALKISKKSEGGSLIFEECSWEDSECFARGKIDILQINDKVATIVDHKTQMYIPRNLGTFQMGFYAWMVKKIYPYVEEVNTVLHFCHPDLNTYRGPFSWKVGTGGDDDLNWVESLLITRISAIEEIGESGENREVIGSHCAYCPVKQECPRIAKIKNKRKSSRSKMGPINSAKLAKEYAESLHVLEENTKSMKPHLKDFTSEFGPVVLPGVEYGYKVSDGWDVPAENKKSLYNLLSEYGVDVWAYLDFDVRKLSKNVWRKLDKQKLEKVKKLLAPTKKTRFGGRKV